MMCRLLTGDYITPQFNAQPRFDKPILVWGNWVDEQFHHFLGSLNVPLTNKIISRRRSILSCSSIGVAFSINPMLLMNKKKVVRDG